MKNVVTNRCGKKGCKINPWFVPKMRTAIPLNLPCEENEFHEKKIKEYAKTV